MEDRVASYDMPPIARRPRLTLLAAMAAGLALFAVAAPARAATSHTAYVSNANANSVTPIDTTTNAPGTAIAVGSGPVAVAITPDAKTAYVTNSGANSVSVIDTATDTVTATIPVGSTPYGAAVAPDGATAYVSNLRGNSVSVIDTATNAVTATVPVGRFPEGIAVTPDGATVFVVNDGDSNVSVIDTATNTTSGTIAVGIVPGPVVITPDGRTAYVGGGGASPSLTPIDVATSTTGTTIPTGNQPFSIAISPDGRTGYSANFVGGSITVFDVATNTATATISGTPFRTPTAVAITPDGSSAYVVDFNANTVIPIDTATNTPGTPIAGFSGPEGVAITPDQPPTAAFSASPAGAGQVSSFDASASTDPDGTIVSYAWDFGDGSPAATTTTPLTSHTYAAAGTYTVTVTETDDAGCSTTRIFTGATASCNGSSTAAVSHDVIVPRPPELVACDPSLATVGCWGFDEFSGTTASDSSGFANHGTYLGGPTLGVPGVSATAVLLDGVNDVVRVPDSASLDVGASFSAEGWIKRSSAAKSHAMMNKGDRGLQLVVMAASTGNQVYLRKANVTTIARSTVGVPADGAYHQVVATVDGANSARIYIDGVEAGTVQVGTVQLIQDTAFPLQFGDGATTPATYDQFALYDGVLTPAQVAAHFAARAH